MKVSIITVVYNNVATICSALDSILSQTYLNKELIIIDGGSTDGTLEKIGQYGKKINVVISEPDNGIYDAMNKGLNLATGDIIAILNSDDLFSTSFVLENVVHKFKQTEADGIFGDLDYVHADDVSKVFRRWISGNYKPGSFLQGWMPPHPTFFVKKAVYDKHGLFDTSFKTAGDYELMLRFVHVYNIELAYLPEVLVKMRTGGVSNSGLKNRIVANLEDRRAWKVNGIKPHFYTLYLKPLRKVFQFIGTARLKLKTTEPDRVWKVAVMPDEGLIIEAVDVES
jgi:glycosyltransferase involved in cell wall biosynthesis